MKKKSLKLNFIMNAILTMSSFIFPLITFPYVSRILLPSGTGKVSFAISLISYFSMFAQLGIPTYGIRACARVRDNRKELTRVVHELLIINMITNVISYAGLFIALALVPKLQEDRILFIICSFTIILTSIGVEWLYKALEHYTYITVRSIFFKLIALISMFILVREQEDYIIYGGISIFASSASNVLNFVNAHKYIDMKLIGKYNVKRHLKSVWIFFAMACATTIYTHIDIVMLGFMTSDVDVGYYNAAIRIKTILVSVVTSLGSVLLPRVSYYVKQGQIDEFKRISRKALNFVFLIAIPLICYCSIYAKEIICFLSGGDYMEAILPMQILMPTLLFIGITNVLGIQILVPLGREKIVLISEIAGAVINIIINIVLIPIWGACGAAIGTLTAEFVVLVIQYHCIKQEVLQTFKQIQYRKIVLAVMIAICITGWIKIFDVADFVKIMISVILFWGIYIISLFMMKEVLLVELMKIIYRKILSMDYKSKWNIL